MCENNGDEDNLEQPQDGSITDTNGPYNHTLWGAAGQLASAARGDPNFQAAGANLGQSAEIVTSAIRNCLLPLAAVNYACDSARQYFSGKFQEELSEKASDIPPERVMEPRPSVAGPSLQGLAFTHGEPELKELYLELLKSAMDSDNADNAHPAFVRVIEQLNGEEANILNGILRANSGIPIAEVRQEDRQSGSGGSFSILYNHLLELFDDETGDAEENSRLPAMVDNWVRLGLVEVDYTKQLNFSDAYEWVEKRPEYIRMKEQYENENKRVEYRKGALRVTNFGKQFGCAVGCRTRAGPRS